MTGFMLPKTPRLLTHNTIFTHYSSNAVFPTNKTFTFQSGIYTGIPVDFSTVFVNHFYFFEQFFIRKDSPTLLPIYPGIIAASTNSQFPTQNRNSATMLVVMDKTKAIYFFPGNILSAFFSTVFSSRNCFKLRSNFFIFFFPALSSDTERAS